MNTTTRPAIFSILSIAFSVVVVIPGIGQSQSYSENNSNGIYFTMEQLKQNTIVNEHITNASNNLSIDIRSNLVVTRNGNQTVLPYGSIAGYYKNGSRYRAYGKRKSSYGFFKIVDDSGLIIYSRRVSTPKTGVHTWCYYSTSIDSPIRSLTAQNLRKDFNDNPGFVEAAIKAMKTRSLMETSEGRTKINELYASNVQR